MIARLSLADSLETDVDDEKRGRVSSTGATSAAKIVAGFQVSAVTPLSTYADYHRTGESAPPLEAIKSKEAAPTQRAKGPLSVETGRSLITCRRLPRTLPRGPTGSPVALHGLDLNVG
jgi:hypothetical protein